MYSPNHFGRWLPFCVRIVLWGLIWMLAMPHIALAQAGTDPAPPSASPGPAAVPSTPAQGFVPGEILVAFRSARAADRIGQSALAAQAAIVAPVDLRTAVEDAAAPIGQLWRVPVGKEQAVIGKLQADPGVVFAEPNWLVYTAQAEAVTAATADREATFTVNDPLYAAYQWYFQRSNFSRAWQQIALYAPAALPVQVAVVDTGIDLDHPEFVGRLLPGFNYVSRGEPPIDDNGHGTHVAGLIAALANNGLGMAGGAGQVLIDPRRALGSSGSGSVRDVADAIRGAADSGARIINLSIQLFSYSSTLADAVQYARNRGVLLVAAAGNAPDCSTVCYPAKFDGVLAVASVTVDLQPAYYSATGAELDLAAGGGDLAAPVVSTWPANATALSHCKEAERVQQNGVWYCAKIGTSMAAPQVSAGAALLLALRPTLTADQVVAILRNTARPLVGVPADRIGAGLMDVEVALRSLVPGETRLSQRSFNFTVPVGSAPFTTTLVLSNPSLEPITVSGALVGGSGWFSGASFGGTNFLTAVRADQPAYVSFKLGHTALVTGTYTGQILMDAQRSDGTHSTLGVPVALSVGALNQMLHLPVVQRGAPVGASTSGFVWERGSNEVSYALGESGRVEIQLPFAFPAFGPNGASDAAYGQAILAADGYVLFSAIPGSMPLVPASNSCLPQLTVPLQAVWAWWSNLNASAPGAQVVTFQPAADRFVIEYRNVASASDVPVPYRVTFQIVLFQNGNVQLNYLQTPYVTGLSLPQGSPRATIGVQSAGGLFRNQVACIAAHGEGDGLLPAGQQSILINRQEVY